MKKSIGTVLFFCALAISAQTKPRLAILPFTGGAVSDAESIAEFFSFEPEITRAFIPVPRTSAVDQIMREQQFQRSGLTDSDTIARLGRQLNADYVLAGHITGLDRTKLLLITIIHVERLQQIAGVWREYQDIEETIDFLPEMARRIVAGSRKNSVDLPRLAILPFNALSSGMETGDAEVLAQILATEITNSGRYAVFPRTSAIERVMAEQHIERSGMTDPESIRKIGNAVNAQYVLSANVRSLGRNKFFSASILHIEQASQELGVRKQYQTVSDGLVLMGELAEELIAATSAEGQAPAGFVFIPGGTFPMGSGPNETGRRNDETRHQVTLDSFYIGKYEVTQREFNEVMETNPGSFLGLDLPVEMVSWFDAVEYCNWRSLKEGLRPAYRGYGNNIVCDWTANGYRLPTEAEWEFAAKGGAAGVQSGYIYAGSDRADLVGWFNENSGNTTRRGGNKAPNVLGLYDMSGNVWEWCWDWYGGDYSNAARTNPRGSTSGSYRVIRGGAWCFSAGEMRSSRQMGSAPQDRYNYQGFRLVRSRQ